MRKLQHIAPTLVKYIPQLNTLYAIYLHKWVKFLCVTTENTDCTDFITPNSTDYWYFLLCNLRNRSTERSRRSLWFQYFIGLRLRLSSFCHSHFTLPVRSGNELNPVSEIITVQHPHPTSHLTLSPHQWGGQGEETFFPAPCGRG